MNNDQSNHLDMYRAVVKHTTSATNQPITNTVIAFKNGINKLKANITAIQLISGEQTLSILGVTGDKTALQLALCETTFSIITPVKAYAVATNNNTLKEQMNYSLTELKETNDDTIGQLAQTLFNIINPLLAPLANYGITAAKMTAWQLAINKYLPVIANPRNAVVHKSSLTDQLKDLFTETNKLLKETLDTLAVNFKTTEPHYFSDYNNARKIIDLGTTTTRITGICTINTPDGEPAYNVKIKINEQDIEALSELDGSYLLNPDAPATITLTASGEGVQSQTTPPFEVKKGDSLHLNFVLIFNV